MLPQVTLHKAVSPTGRFGGDGRVPAENLRAYTARNLVHVGEPLRLLVSLAGLLVVVIRQPT